MAPPINILKPAARLKYFLRQWEILTQDPIILDIVRGYRVIFHTQPWQKAIPVTYASNENAALLSKEISKLVQKGAVSQLNNSTNGFYSRLFLVPKKGGDLRPVIDLSNLNRFITNEHFQMENILSLRHLLNPQDLMAKVDLKDAYLTVGVHEDTQPFLRFIWQGQTYQFQALPFGLSTAPRVFTKLLKPVVSSLRTQNIRLIVYLDDILLVGPTLPILTGQTTLVLELLQNLGFIINFQKSILAPSAKMEFLGLVVDSHAMMFLLPPLKVTKTIEMCNTLLHNNPTMLRRLAQLYILGFLESIRPAIWLAPLHFRHLQNCLIQQVTRNRGSYDGLVTLSPLAQQELQWWISNIHRVNGSPIQPPTAELTITSDASKQGWGATFNQLRTRGSWSAQERLLHINVLELKAAFLAIQTFLKLQSNIVAKLKLDNTTAVAYINNKGGTRSPELTMLALDLWTWCVNRNIFIQAEHLPGIENYQADKESRTCTDSSDWKIQPNLIQRHLVDRNIDLFASRLTHQLPRYVSWYPDPQAFVTDAFTLNWAVWNGYAFPPFNLIPRTLTKVEQDKATLVLVAPIWQGQTWWPLLLQMAIGHPIRLPSTPETLQDPTDPATVHPMYPRLHLAVWLISSDRAQQKAFQKTLPVYSQPRHVNLPTKPTILHGRNGMAGVIHGKLIRFLQA